MYVCMYCLYSETCSDPVYMENYDQDDPFTPNFNPVANSYVLQYILISSL